MEEHGRRRGKSTWKGVSRIVNWEDRITVDPAVLVGKPVVKGTRLAVEFIIGLLAEGWSEADVLKNYSGLAHEDLLACLAYAAEILRSEGAAMLRERL